MNARELRLLLVLLVILGGGGGSLVVYQWFVKPLRDANRQIDKLGEAIEEKGNLVSDTLEERKMVERARLMSLSPNATAAQDELGRYLYPLLMKCKLEVDTFSPSVAPELKGAAAAPGTTALKPGHQIVAIRVRAKGEMINLVRALELLQRTPLVHRIKGLDIARIDTSPKGTSDKLLINMTIESLVISKAPTHIDGDFLAPDQGQVKVEVLMGRFNGPQGMALLPWIVGPRGTFAQKRLESESAYRAYDDIAYKNIFNGLVVKAKEIKVPTGPEVDPTTNLPILDYVILDTTDPDGREAYFRNKVIKIRPVKVRSASYSGFNIFQIQNEFKTTVMLRAKVLRIDQRDVYFQVGRCEDPDKVGDVYCVHLGQSLGDAMRKRINDSEQKRLDLARLYDNAWALAEAAEMNMKSNTSTSTAPPKKKKGR